MFFGKVVQHIVEILLSQNSVKSETIHKNEKRVQWSTVKVLYTVFYLIYYESEVNNSLCFQQQKKLKTILF